MQLQITFTRSGDCIKATPINREFVEWYVGQAGTHGNAYHNRQPTGQETFRASGRLVHGEIKELNTCLGRVNKAMKGLGRPRVPDFRTSLYDQRTLNQIHKHWTGWIAEDPDVEQKFKDLKLDSEFRGINELVHTIEDSFRYTLATNSNWQAPNLFRNAVYKPGRYNISMNYSETGKTSYHKWRDGDTDPNDHELSNWQNISGSINVDLGPPKIYEHNTDYQDYCEHHGVRPVPLFLPIANINDSDRLAEARELMNRNMDIQDNAMVLNTTSK